MEVKYRLADKGTNFATRYRANEIIEDLLAHIGDGPVQRLVIDMRKVQALSPSFTVAFLSSLDRILTQSIYKNNEIEVLVDNPSVRSRVDQTIHYIMEYSKRIEPLEKMTVRN